MPHYPWCCGVPLCWPVFADDTSTGIAQLGLGKWGRSKSDGFSAGVPMHGLARYLISSVVQSSPSRATLELKSGEQTKWAWAADFDFNYSVELKDDGRLVITASVTNIGTTSFKQQLGFHTYFPCASLSDLSVCNPPGQFVSFSGVQFIDKMDGYKLKRESRKSLTFGKRAMDFVYRGVSSFSVSNRASRSRIDVRAKNLGDVVVFSPLGNKERARTVRLRRVS